MLLNAQTLSLERRALLAALREEARHTAHTRDDGTAALIQAALEMLQSGSPSGLSSNSSSFACLSPTSPLSPSSPPSEAFSHSQSLSQSQSPFPLLSLALLTSGMDLEPVAPAALTRIPSFLSVPEPSTPPSLLIPDAPSSPTHCFVITPFSVVPLTLLPRSPSEALIMPPPTASRPSSFLETLPVLEGSEGAANSLHSRRGSKFLSQDYTHRQIRGAAIEALAAADTGDSPQTPPSAPRYPSIELSCKAPNGAVSGADGPLSLPLSAEAWQADLLLEGATEERIQTQRSRVLDEKGTKEESKKEEVKEEVKGEEQRDEAKEEEGADDGCASEEGDLFEGDQGYGLSYTIGQNAG